MLKTLKMVVYASAVAGALMAAQPAMAVDIGYAVQAGMRVQHPIEELLEAIIKEVLGDL